MATQPTAAADLVDTRPLDEIVQRIGGQQENLIALLRAIQDEYGFLPEETLRRLPELTALTAADISAVATFYTLFRHRPAGCHTIGICVGTACHVKGAEAVYQEFLRELHIAPGEDTDAERRFTLEKVACLGCCTLAPAVQIEDTVYGHVHPPRVPRVIADFLESRTQRPRRSPPKMRTQGAAAGEIRLGLGSCCQARGSGRVLIAVEEALAQSGAHVTLKHVGCVGICSQTPLVEVVMPDGSSTTYSQVEPEQARDIVLRHFRPAGLLRRLRAVTTTALDRLYTAAETTADLQRHPRNVRDPKLEMEEFLRPQKHVATECAGELDPVDLGAYRRGGGFKALDLCRQHLQPAEIIQRVKDSGLRGRGGAGYPTGRKWEQVRSAGATTKYVVCNGDEGDPGAFMDRMLLESYPYRVLEGIAIAAQAIGAKAAILYIRAEYPLALQRIREAIERMTEAGLLGGEGPDGTSSLSMRIVEGAGAFVCGEETALLASIEGRRGMPRLRPPFPAEAGLWGKPTLVNNVETFADIPWILRHGPEAFAAMGTEHSKGTKVFALAGKIVRGGLIEVPMGISLREVVEVIGGGVPAGRTFKAAQVGGPSGGCVPAKLADTPIDYEALSRVGAIMGSGGIVVLDDTDCMVDIARYFLEFTQAQSCGRCAPCRIGTRRMLDILESLCAGKASQADLKTLEELAHMVKRTSLCGLGQTAPNPVLSTLTHFREEYEAHLNGRCPAGKCAALVRYSISDRCIGCTRCAQRCPVEAIPLNPLKQHEIDQTRCVKCGSCRDACPVEAVEVH